MSPNAGLHMGPTVAMVIGMSLLISVSASAQPGTTVVVAPFTNLSQQTTDDWIGAGIVETVSSDLQNAGLTVMGRRGSDADWLVDGGFQRIGNLLRITASVTDGATGTVTYSTRVDGTFGNLFDLQDEVGAALAAWLLAASTLSTTSTPPGTAHAGSACGGSREHGRRHGVPGLG